MANTSSPAGPSRHRRKQTAENWDDDFEFALPSRSKPPPSASSSKHLDQDSGESRANQGSRHVAKSSKTRNEKGKEVEEEEDWDTGGKWDEPSLGPVLPSRTSIQVRRGSKGPTPLKIPSSQSSSRHQGLPRSSPSSSSPLPSPPSQSSSIPAGTPDEVLLPGMSRRPKSNVAEESLVRNKSMQRQSSSTSFAPPPTAPTVAISNDSSSSLISWTKFNRSSPNLPPASLPDIAYSSTSPHPRRSDRERELRHMKSGEIMPPPPVPGSSLLRRKSKKDRDRDKDVRESQVPFSPSMEQLRGAEMEGKKGFWKRFSGNAGAMSKGSPTSLHTGQELRRRRSSSVGSPTKIRPNLSPANQPPLPPLRNNIRSPSAASSTSANSATSFTSQSAFRSAGITGILRKSTSSLIRRSPSTKKNGSGQGTPPSAHAPVSPWVPTRTSSRSSQLSAEGDSAMTSVGPMKSHSRRNPSVSRGYHLPSPAPGSPYHPNSGYFDDNNAPPLPHSASFTSQIPARSQRGYSGSITGTDTEYECDEAQTTPKRKKKSVSGVISIGKSRGESTGWTGDGWNGLPPSTSQGFTSGLPTGTTSQTIAPALPTRTSSRSNLRLPSSQSVHLPLSTSPATFDRPEDPPRSFSTLRRLSSLSKKHGRRLSGGFKFGTNGSSSSAEERKEENGRRGKLETVVGSPIKGARIAGDRIDHDQADEAPILRQISPVRSAANGEDISDKHKTDRYTRAGSVSAPTSVLKPPSRDIEAEWTNSNYPVTGLPEPSGMPTINGKNVSILAKEAKERRRQSWNDFVIPRNVLDKQRELKRGIEGVRRFAGGVETLKSLLAAHSNLSSRLSLSSDPANLARFDSLDREFAQWWEMATVLIEVGSTGQGIGQEQSVSYPPEAESPKRSRRITLASDEAKFASDLMRRTQSTPLQPAYAPTTSSSTIMGKAEPRKSSLPDPSDVAQSSGFLGAGGPPRASPDLWRASTGRQDLSKRQLEVLRTMLKTPVSDSSIPQRNDPLRGMSTISTSSTSAFIAPGRQEEPSGPQAYRPSISRASTTDSQYSDRSLVHFDSPRPTRTAGTPGTRGPETFPSPNDSAYIVPSQSFPSPITASTLAYGRPGSGLDPSKMRRGSKVGLAGLREFLRGLKGKESKKDLRAIRVNQVYTHGSPTPGSPRYNPSREGLPLPLSPTSPTAKYPFAWRHKPTPSYIELSHPLTLPTHPDSRRPSDTPSITGTPPTPLTSITPTKPTVAGPPVSGKERRRPGLRGIFRAGSGSWSDLVNSSSTADKRASKDGIPGPQYPRVGSGGSTESAPAAPRNLLRSTPSTDQFGASGTRSTSGPSRLSVAEEGEMTVRPRKSRIMGLGWPEEAAAAREIDRTVSHSSNFTEVSVGEEEVDGRGSEEGEVQIALTPESLPVLLEYLRQCEAKLGEWKERVAEIV